LLQIVFGAGFFILSIVFGVVVVVGIEFQLWVVVNIAIVVDVVSAAVVAFVAYI
jgi:hypothetical protein